MTLPKLRWGILGVAGINKRLIPAFKASTTASLDAIASRSIDKAAAAAKADAIAKPYGSYEALLADPDIDAVYNPLPNVLHDEWIAVLLARLADLQGQGWYARWRTE